ncbi:hypothetical protein OIO90_001078 [Microbotryomycetes sp. JL221]|nr:hypothetical protein OIO90_001078 [Microbotryomycetes sp. JL221]
MSSAAPPASVTAATPSDELSDAQGPGPRSNAAWPTAATVSQPSTSGMATATAPETPSPSTSAFARQQQLKSTAAPAMSAAASAIFGSSALPAMTRTTDSSNERVVGTTKPAPDEERERKRAKEARGVSSAKYRKLKRKFIEVDKARTDSDLALHRAQRLIHDMRTDQQNMLDRILSLETAAGITSADVAEAQQRLARGTTNQPASALPTASSSSLLTDIKRVAGPPRLHSKHLVTQLAVQKFETDQEARARAQQLDAARYPTLVALGLLHGSVPVVHTGASFRPASTVPKQRPSIVDGAGDATNGATISSTTIATSPFQAPRPPIPSSVPPVTVFEPPIEDKQS